MQKQISARDNISLRFAPVSYQLAGRITNSNIFTTRPCLCRLSSLINDIFCITPFSTVKLCFYAEREFSIIYYIFVLCIVNSVYLYLSMLSKKYFVHKQQTRTDTKNLDGKRHMLLSLSIYRSSNIFRIAYVDERMSYHKSVAHPILCDFIFINNNHNHGAEAVFTSSTKNAYNLSIFIRRESRRYHITKFRE